LGAIVIAGELAEFLEFGDGAFRVQSAHAPSSWRGSIEFQPNKQTGAPCYNGDPCPYPDLHPI
jgi:hypothetical protein